MPRIPSAIEASFEVWLRQNPDIPPAQQEYAFHPTRKWRFDFAWPEIRFAVELEGMTYGGEGRHQRVDGFLGDAEKYEAAMLLGWTVYRIPGPWVISGSRAMWRDEAMEAIRTMYGRLKRAKPRLERERQWTD